MAELLRRRAEKVVRDALEDTPVVLIHGPRQCGKSTLAQMVGQGRRFVTLDDPEPLHLAKTRPAEFFQVYKAPLSVDEVQRAPELFLALKAQVDRHREPGSYLLTGSANVLLLPKMADSLAGRMEVVDLTPLTQGELGHTESRLLDQIFDPSLELPRHIPTTIPLVDRILAGGFPEPALRKPHRRRAWFDAYVRTLVERDVRDLANIDGLTQLPRLLTLLAGRAGEPLNISGLSRELNIPHTTLTRYIDLLRSVFLLQLVPSWSVEEGPQMAKSPKVFLVDSGLQAELLRTDVKRLADDGERLTLLTKNFVANELARWRVTHEERPGLMHLRTIKHKEIDFILESRDGRLVGIDLSLGLTVHPDDAEGLEWLREVAEDRFYRGFVLYRGEEVRPIGRDLWAVPYDFLWAS